MPHEAFQPTDCIRSLQTRMLRPFQVSVEGMGCAVLAGRCRGCWCSLRAGWATMGTRALPVEFLYGIGRLNKQQRFLQAWIATSFLTISFKPPILAGQRTKGLIKKSSVKELPTPVTMEAAKAQDQLRSEMKRAEATRLVTSPEATTIVAWGRTWWHGCLVTLKVFWEVKGTLTVIVDLVFRKILENTDST